MKVEKAGRFLASFVEGLGNEKLITLIQDWKKTVGEHCASHSHIKDLKKNVLLVEVDDPAWITYMHEYQEVYLRKLQKTQKAINSIHFVLGYKNKNLAPVPPAAPLPRKKMPPASLPRFPKDKELQEKFRHIADMINNQESNS